MQRFMPSRLQVLLIQCQSHTCSGCAEWHGPHLPLGTENYIAEAFAERIAKRVGGLVFPQTYGYQSRPYLIASLSQSVVMCLSVSGIRCLESWHALALKSLLSSPVMLRLPMSLCLLTRLNVQLRHITSMCWLSHHWHL